jgi:hypothetical protein
MNTFRSVQFELDFNVTPERVNADSDERRLFRLTFSRMRTTREL